jgi:hypothetical protein
MRNSKAFFSVAITAAAALLAGTAVMAAGPKATRSRRPMTQQQAITQQQAAPPTTCTTEFEAATFTVTRGPTFVPCEVPGGQCTEIEYQQVSGSRRAVYVLEGKGVVAVYPPNEGTVVGPPCLGVDGFGAGACHEQAVRTFPDEGGVFSITVEGVRRPSPTSVAVNVEGLESCEILGLGLENSPNPDQTTQTTETIDFEGCAVTFLRDAQTGDVVSAALDPDQSTKPLCTSPGQQDCCRALFAEEDGTTLVPQPVTELEVTLADGTTLGKGKFGDGYISTGGDSCTTRVIGGKVYTWGKPCP